MKLKTEFKNISERVNNVEEEYSDKLKEVENKLEKELGIIFEDFETKLDKVLIFIRWSEAFNKRSR